MKRTSSVLVVAFILLVGCERKPSGQDRLAAEEENVEDLRTPVSLGLTIEQLQKTSDGELESLLFNAMSRSLVGRHEQDYQIVKAWPPGLRMLYTTYEVEGEVNNGGFNQYFWNTEGKCATLALEGFRLIGAEQYAQLMERAIRVHEEESPRMKKYQDQGTIEAFSESYKDTKLNGLDDEFYKLDLDLLSQLRLKYIRAHLGECVVP